MTFYLGLYSNSFFPWTDIFAKIAEGIIAKWVVQDIQDSVDINQFGNIQGVSIAHYLLNLMDVLFQGADKPKEYWHSSPHRLLQGF